MLKDKISIIGAGGHCRPLLDVLLEKFKKKNLSIYDLDFKKRTKELILGIKIQGGISKLKKKTFPFLAIGNNYKREAIYNSLKIKYNLKNLISKTSKISNFVKLGKANFINKGVFIGTDVKIGNNNIINTEAIVEHETIIKDHSHIGPKTIIGGRAKIGKRVFLGLGTRVLHRVEICDDCTIGAGSVVTENIVHPGTYVGAPARKVIKNFEINRIKKKKLILATYGDVGIALLQNIFKIGFNSKNLLIYTHFAQQNNQRFLDLVKYLKINFVMDNKKKDLIKQKFRSFKPDLLFSFHYRKKISSDLLNIPKYKSINLHPSLLPKYAGCFSSVWAIFNGEKQTGISFHYMTKKFDAGNIILQKKLNINRSDTAYSLFHKLLFLSLNNLESLFDLIFNNHYKGFKQDLKNRSYYSRVLPNKGFINVSWTLDKVDRLIRSMYFPPFKGACLKKDKKNYQITSVNQFKKIK